MKWKYFQKWAGRFCAAAAAAMVCLSTGVAVPADTTQTAAQANSQDEEKTHSSYSLKEIGSISDSYRSVDTHYGTLIAFRGSSYDLLNMEGETALENIAGSEALFDNYLTAAKKVDDEEDKNVTGLYTLEGEEIIPCKAASITMPRNRADRDCRFLKVIYVTEVTQNQDECILYFSDSFISLSPGVDDIMYKGYFKVFDLQEKKFAGDKQFTATDSYALQECGNSFLVNEDDKYTLYDKDGKELASYPESDFQDCGYDCFIVSDRNGGYIVNDDMGRETYRSNTYVGPVSNSDHGYLQVSDYNTNTSHVIDKNGKKICDYGFDTIYEEHGDLFRGTDEDNNNVLVDQEGKVIAKTTGEIDYQCEDYYLVQTGLSDFTLYSGDGVVAEGITEEKYSLDFSKDDHMLVINIGKFTVPLDGEFPSTLLCAMARVSKDGGERVYDLFTGEVLCSSEDCYETALLGNYLVQRSGDEWKVYQVLYKGQVLQASRMKN